MIHATGHTHAGDPQLVLGLTAEDGVALLAGQVVTIDMETINPLMAPLRIILMGGQTDDTMLAKITEAFPQVWRLDQITGNDGGPQ